MTTPSAGALAGIRVIDLTRVLGGPYCTQMLGDHGAEVIKLEPPAGDETRGWGPPFRAEDGAASYFVGVNRNKQNIALDLTKPRGREVLLRLLEDADVLVENFKAGTLERWGIGYEVLKERFPRLIHCQVSGFGADGPLGGRVGYDAVIQAMAGLMTVNGDVGSDPLRIGIPLVDLSTGLNAMIGILLALIERGVSGKGQFVQAALFDSAVAMLHPHLANFFMSGKKPVRSGNAHPNVAPYDCFQSKTVAIFLGVGNDGQFAKFARIVGHPEWLEDARFATNGLRGQNRPALRAAIAPVLAELDGQAIADTLLEAGVPCGPVLEIDAVIDHPQTRHRQMVVEHGDYRGFGTPVKLSRTPGAVRSVPQAFGAATRRILQAAGYGEADIDSLVAEKIAFTEPPKR
jgi:crotonobetainyl-CoA:carnitine CoA-transferase CaiB-like acyl-CoA transferase